MKGKKCNCVGEQTTRQKKSSTEKRDTDREASREWDKQKRRNIKKQIEQEEDDCDKMKQESKLKT